MKALKREEILVLRTCNNDLTSYNGFKYPEKGYVEAPDFIPTFTCGGGLHGLPWGVGSIYYFIQDAPKWQVIRVNTNKNYLYGEGNLRDKCKFKSGFVEYTGTREVAIQLILKHAPSNIAINFATLKAGDNSTLTAGYNSTLTAGYNSTLTAGDNSTLKAGYRSTLKAGYNSTLTAGDNSTLKAGYRSTLKAGDESTLTAGDNSTLTAGYNSTLTAGDESTLTAGDNSTLKAGYRSTLTAGDNSTLKAGYRSTLTAGDNSTLTAGNMSYMKAGKDTVQICNYYNNGVIVKMRLISEKNAGIWYRFKHGKWYKCSKNDLKIIREI